MDNYKCIQSVINSLFLGLILTMVVFGSPVQAGSQEQHRDVDQLSKELVNPIGPNWLINTYFNVTKKDGDITNKSRTSKELLFQPVLPIPLDDKEMGLTLMNRPTLPVILSNSVPKTDEYGNFSGFNSATGIGDLMIQTAIGSMPHASFGMYMWGVGVALMFPTASDDDIGSEKYSAGPSGMLVGYTEKWTFGIVANQVWSYAGDSDREYVN